MDEQGVGSDQGWVVSIRWKEDMVCLYGKHPPKMKDFLYHSYGGY